MHRLDLEREGPDLFVGHSDTGPGMLFGGFVAAQATMAAARTVSNRCLESLHAYFLRPARYGEAIRFWVTRHRDGATIATRAVQAEQSGVPVFTMMANFARGEEGPSHQDPMPPAPGPEGLPEWEELRTEAQGAFPSPDRRNPPIEARVCDPDSPDPAVRLPARRRVWLRPRGTLPDDPVLHAATLVYASDRTLLRTAGRPHGLTWRPRVGVSLDHAVWLHRPPRFDDWLLYLTESPVAHGGRALLLGAMYRSDGVRVASVAQGALLRR